MSEVIHRRHYCLHFDELARRIGAQGEIIRVWVELDNDYIHIMTEDPTARATARGGYVEIERFPKSPIPETQKAQESQMAEFVLEDVPEFDPIPDGEILEAEVANVEIRDSFYEDERNPGQKKKQVSFRFQVTDPESYGRVVFGNTPMTFSNHSECKLRVWVQELLGEDELPVGFKFDTDTLIGLPCRIAVGLRESVAPDGRKKQKNYIADVLRISRVATADKVF